MRVKSECVHHAEIRGAIGVQIVAPDIGRIIAGTSVLASDHIDDVTEGVQSDIDTVKKSLETDHRGVMVHASTLGALEGLLQFLRDECKPPIPVSHVNIGPIHKKDVMRANIMKLVENAIHTHFQRLYCSNLLLLCVNIPLNPTI